MSEAKTVNLIVHGSTAKGVGKALKKTKKQIRGLRGGIISLSIVCGFLLSELMERKRCENYLKAEIDELREYAEKIEKVESDLVETVNNDILPKLKTDGGDADA